MGWVMIKLEVLGDTGIFINASAGNRFSRTPLKCNNTLDFETFDC
jgi:hypothetical protein